MPRNYRKEYDTYHSTPEQKQDRASRNAVRRDAIKKHGESALKGKEVDHKDGNPRNNNKRNLQIISRKANRQKGG